MLPILLVAVAAGAACGLSRLKVWALVPVTAVYSMTALIDGIINGLGLGSMALMLFAGATALQLSYLIGGLVSEERKRPAPDAKLARLDLIRLMQSAIGQELRTSYPLPENLSPQLRDRIALLSARYG